ncbi:hypothetical protein [Sorangium cellulosum]|uniref:hypothetical protein n=1 Tax=Sorangium cellulosum TaxID=56 RepID=UPI0004072AF4|nr:hypothetical protein [Sorangium cellulosum]
MATPRCSSARRAPRRRAAALSRAVRRAAALGALALALALALAAPPREARAGGAPRIVVVAPSREDRVSLRLQAELRALKFEVPEVEIAPDPPSRERLEEVAREKDAVAAVRIAPSSGGVEVWLVDRMTGKTVLREMVTDDTRSPSGGAALALRVVELLRASLMELDAPRPPAGEVAPPPSIREMMASPRADTPAPAPSVGLPPPRGAAFSIELGPAVLLSPGGMGPWGLLSAAANYQPSEEVGASVFALIPLLSSSASGPEGVATARVGLVGAAISGVVAPPGAPWRFAVGAGASAVWMRLEGRPSERYEGSTEDLLTVAPLLRAGLGVAITPRLRVRADAICGVAILVPVVEFAGRQVATWGVPLVAPSLDLELVWP